MQQVQLALLERAQRLEQPALVLRQVLVQEQVVPALPGLAGPVRQVRVERQQVSELQQVLVQQVRLALLEQAQRLEQPALVLRQVFLLLSVRQEPERLRELSVFLPVQQVPDFSQ